MRARAKHWVATLPRVEVVQSNRAVPTRQHVSVVSPNVKTAKNGQSHHAQTIITRARTLPYPEHVDYSTLHTR